MKTDTQKDTQKDTNRILVQDATSNRQGYGGGVRKATLQRKHDDLPVVIERNGTMEWVKPEDLGYS